MDFLKVEKKQFLREVSFYDIIDFLVDYIWYDKFGLIVNVYFVYVDSNENGIFLEECYRFVKMYFDVVDFFKIGKNFEIDGDLCFKLYLDFMMKCDK